MPFKAQERFIMDAPQTVVYGKSHVGIVRSDNQDSIRVYTADNPDKLQTHGHLYAIADGMGGYEHGGIASAQALETFFDSFYSGPPAKPGQNLRQGIQAANLAVYQSAQRLGARMGTTLSAVNLIGHQVHIAHIGDSRVYLVRGHKSLCLTKDHTAVGELVRMKILSPDKVRTHERRSILEKCLGMQLFIQPDISQYTLTQDDYLVLCTDGVWAHVEDDEFAHITHDVKTPEQISQTLIDLALERNSDDNVSAIVVHVETLASAPAMIQERRTWGLSQLLRGKLTGKA
jgi:protein phosphatase